MSCDQAQRKRFDYPGEPLVNTTVNALTVDVCRNGLPETDFTVLVTVNNPDGTEFTTHTPALVGNEFVIPQMVFPSAGKYNYTVQFTYPDGTVKIYLFGEIKVVTV